MSNIFVCDADDCDKKALYTVKVKKNDDNDKAYRLCQEHRDRMQEHCKQKKYEFMVI